MKKQFFLALISILLLVACAGEQTLPTEENQDDNPDQTDFMPSVEGTPEDEDTPVDEDTPAVEVEASSQPSQESEVPVFQICQTNLLNATWICTKEDETYTFFLNRQRFLRTGESGTEEVKQRILRVDEPGTERERQRICEIEITKSNAEGEFSVAPDNMPRAHWEWGYCVRFLNEAINYGQNQKGLKCEKEGEEFATEEDTRNHNNHCTFSGPLTPINKADIEAIFQ